MKDKIEIRRGFSRRLNQALDKKGIPPKGLGRQTETATLFGVTQNAARKWLEGQGLPSREMAETMSACLGVSYGWLMDVDDRVSVSPGGQVPVFTVTSICAADADPIQKADWDGIGPDAVAVTIDDDAMAPEIRRGDLLAIDATVKHRPGGYVLVCPADGSPATVRRVKGTPGGDEYIASDVFHPTHTQESVTRVLTVVGLRRLLT